MVKLDNESLQSAGLESHYGKSITPNELGKFLGIDPRTVKRYASKWGGVEVSPGKYRFFENRVMEVINAELNNETRKEALERHDNVPRKKTGQAISGRFEEIVQGSGSVGKGNAEKASRTTDRHGLLDGI